MPRRDKARAAQDRAYDRLRVVCMEKLGNVAKALQSVYNSTLDEEVPEPIRSVWAQLGNAPKRDGLQ